jgi:uncharacterized protein YjbJ (UPF0337 family)
MSIIDKLTGKAKKAAGSATGSPALRREGREEERKGQTKDELHRAEERVAAKAQEVADLERRSS